MKKIIYNTPKISVIIPCYNTEKYLPEALDSIINQTFKEIEIICVDDCSKDKTNEILQNYAKKDKRIKIFKNNKNIGAGETRNFAINKVNPKSKYIAQMDSDDISLPTRLQEQWDYMEKNSDIDISGTGFKTLSAKNGIVRKCKPLIDHKKIVKRLFVSNQFASPTMIFRKSFFDKYDIKYKDITTEDYDLWARCFVEYNAKFGNIRKSLLRYRIHSNQTTNANRKIEVRDVQKIKKYLREHDKFRFYLYNFLFTVTDIKKLFTRSARRWILQIKFNKKRKKLRLFGIYLINKTFKNGQWEVY